MLTIPATIQALFKSDAVRKNFRVQFPNGELPDITNENVVSESVQFTESLCSADTFRFGLAEASVLEFETVGIGNMYGMTISGSIEIDTTSLSAADITAIQADPGDGTLVLAADSDIGFGFYRVPYGVFIINSCPRDHQAMTHRKVTAYSDDGLNQQMQLPSGVFEEIAIDTDALLAYADPSMRTDLGEIALHPLADAIKNRQGSPLFGSDGLPYYINLFDLDDSESPMYYFANLPASCDFFSFDCPTPTQSAYEALGKSIATSLTNTGLDLTYDAHGNKIFSNNEEALRFRKPHLFGGISYSHTVDNAVTKSKILLNNLLPTLRGNGFSPVVNGAKVSATGSVSLIRKNVSGNSIRVKVRKYAEYPPTDSGTHITGWDTSKDGLLVNPSASIHAYSSSSYSGKDITVLPSGSGEENVFNNSTYYIEKRTIYTFANFGTWQAVIGDTLEVNGEFLKQNRLGGCEVVTLDDSSPIAVSPGEYESIWWDEYSISPIGTVTVTYENAEGDEETVDVDISEGLSRYDMSENKVLRNISGGTISGMTTLLTGDFLTNSAAAAITPVEFDMLGMPWIEAGDALTVTTEDNQTIDLYVLRMVISGIQHLSASIETQSGDLISQNAMQYGGGGLSAGGTSKKPPAYELLWTNANPTTNFTAQTVAVDFTDYTFFGIVSMFSTSSQYMLKMQIFPVVLNADYILEITGRGSTATGGRRMSYTNSGLAFQQGTYAGTNEDTHLIPYQIYGIR